MEKPKKNTKNYFIVYILPKERRFWNKFMLVKNNFVNKLLHIFFWKLYLKNDICEKSLP